MNKDKTMVKGIKYKHESGDECMKNSNIKLIHVHLLPNEIAYNTHLTCLH